MKKRLGVLFAFGFVLLQAAAPAADIREPAVAGKFYPDDAGKLRAAVLAYLDDARPPLGERPLALVAPHAGYVFSGQIAADAYRQAMGQGVDLVVVLGTNHTAPPFDGVSVYGGAGYRTPLGVAPVDPGVTKALLEADRSFRFRPEVHAREHSVEVQIPFVQVAFPEASIVAAVMGRPDPDLGTRLGEALARLLKGRRALVVASSDLSHYPGYGDAVAVDGKTLRAVASMDVHAIRSALSSRLRERRPGLDTCACGEGPIYAAIAAARALGARRGIVVSYANSGDTPFGEPGRVVGYGAVAFTAGPGGTDTSALPSPAAEPESAPLTQADRSYLLRLARSTVERLLTTDTVPLPRPDRPALLRRRGAFVTLKKGGELRGCIGHMAEDTPLALTVSRMAIQAALNDRRFPPVRPDEIPALEVEISALTPFERVPGYGSITVGRDGVLIRKDGRQAVFLPQVAPEQGWTREEMLDHLCRKAGLPADCWRSGCEFHTFQAEVFHEERGTPARFLP